MSISKYKASLMLGIINKGASYKVAEVISKLYDHMLDCTYIIVNSFGHQ